MPISSVNLLVEIHMGIILLYCSCTYLMSGCEDGSITVWDFDSGNSLHALLSDHGESPIKSIAAGPNGKAITVCGDK